MAKQGSFNFVCFRKALIVLVTFLSIATACRAQTDTTSLYRDLQSVDNEQKLKAYERLYRHFQYIDPDSSAYYLTQGFSQFTAARYRLGVATMLLHMGTVYSLQGSADLSKKTVNDALKIFVELNDKKGIASANNSLGVLLGRRSNYTDAVEHFFVALKVYESIHDTDGMAGTYVKLGAANQFSNNLDEALAFLNKGLALLKNKPVNDNVVFLTNNIGSVYAQMNKLDTAEVYFKKALELSNKPELAQVRILSLTNMGNMADIKYHDTAAALSYFRQALAIANYSHLPEQYARATIGIASIVSRTNSDLSLVILNELLQKTRTDGDKKLQAEVLGAIMDYYKAKGDFKQALFYMELYNSVEDSISNIDKARAIASLLSIREDEKLSARIEELKLAEQKEKQKKDFIIVVSGLLAICLAIVVFFLRKTRLLYASLSRRKAQLTKNNEVKDKIFSIIGHDLMGAVGAIPPAVQIAMDPDLPANERQELMSLVEQRATVAYETLHNLLSWGKAQIQGIVLKQVNIDANKVIDEVLRFITIAANSKQLTINKQIPAGIIVYADPDHFGFVVRNLLSNAVKYSSAGGMVDFKAALSDDGTMVVFSIKDDGIGILADKKGEIFDSFGVTTDGTANEKGNGIGLKLCKEFITENGGEIWVESEQNKGATFYFSLMAKR